MRARVLRAKVAVGVGVAWLVVDQVLGWVMPERWLGPNIGGGLLLIAAIALIGYGAFVLLTQREDLPPGA